MATPQRVAIFVWWLFWWLLVFTESGVSGRAHVNGCSVAVSGFAAIEDRLTFLGLAEHSRGRPGTSSNIRGMSAFSERLFGSRGDALNHRQFVLWRKVTVASRHGNRFVARSLLNFFDRGSGHCQP